MPKSTYPIMVGDPILRSCRRCRSRVALPAMCATHPRTCLTCCCSRMKRECWEPVRHTTPSRVTVRARPLHWEERQADKARLNHELGFAPYTPEQLADDEIWRTA